MKQFVRMLALFLACITVLCVFASCKKDTPDENPNTEASGTEAETVNDADTLGSYDFGGAEFNILAREETLYEYEAEFNSESTIVEQAVYNRNTEIEDRFNVIINIEPTAGSHEQRNAFTTLMTSNAAEVSSQWHMVSAHGTVISPLQFNGFSYDLTSLPEFDVTKKWWSEAYYNECNFNGKLYFAVGDIAYTMYEYMQVIFVNEALYDEKQIGDSGDIGALYDLVRDGNWTWAKLKEYSSAFAADDLNGESQEYGLALNLHSFRALVTAMDTPFTYREDGVIKYYETPTEKMGKIFVDMQDFLTKRDDMLCKKIFTDDATSQNQMFIERRILFYGQWLKAAATLRGMDDSFGVLPFPKYDDLQEDYFTTGANSVSAIMVPNNIKDEDVEMTGVIIEALSMYGYNDITPSYYEDTLTYQVIGTEDGQDMLELIRESYTMSFSLAYTYGFGDDHPFAAHYAAFHSGSDTLTSKWGQYYPYFKRVVEGMYTSMAEYYK